MVSTCFCCIERDLKSIGKGQLDNITSCDQSLFKTHVLYQECLKQMLVLVVIVVESV